MRSFEQWLLELPKSYVFDSEISAQEYIPLKLSVDNKALQTIDISSSEALETYIKNHMQHHNAKVAYGGYLETRNIYNRSAYFRTKNSESERNIHLGLDLWIEAGTPIIAPLEAKVHSFKNNTNFGDYGPTIILEHEWKDIHFYTLYGHLSLESIEYLKVGQTVKQGEQIATLGDALVNGDYAPHLHFQIIKDMQGYVGDYPGVCSKQDLEFYEGNCPDPNVLLRLD